jgi:hypothetical protein
VLLLYDSCHPANGHGSVKSSRAVIELLAATGFESIAPEVGRDSFTNCLIQELSAAANRPNGISVPELHRRQICRIHRGDVQAVVMERNVDGKMRVRTADGAAIFETPRRRTPIHCQLSVNHRPRAIVLAPLPDEASSTLATRTEFVDLGTFSGDTNRSCPEAPPRLHALLRVSLVEGEFNETEFKDWLCSAPAAAKGIKVLGVLPSCSTLLLLRVPIEVWDLLSPSPAVSFVAFVQDTESGANSAALPAPSGDTSQTRLVGESTNLARGTKGKEIDAGPLRGSSTSIHGAVPSRMLSSGKQTPSFRSLAPSGRGIDEGSNTPNDLDSQTSGDRRRREHQLPPADPRAYSSTSLDDWPFYDTPQSPTPHPFLPTNPAYQASAPESNHPSTSYGGDPFINNDYEDPGAPIEEYLDDGEDLDNSEYE